MRKNISMILAAGLCMAILMGAGTPGTTEGRRNGSAQLRGSEAAVVNVPGIAQVAEEKRLEEEERKLEEEAATAGRTVADLKIDAYFADSVIVGDSIVMGYRNYFKNSADAALKSMRFLAAGSFSVHNALWPVDEKSVHPLYKGKQQPVWESISMMGAKSVFLFFGMNDLGVDDDTCKCYQEVIGHIQELNPGVDIHIISMTYTLKGQGKKRLNNDNIRAFNEEMKALAEANGWGFIDMATPLADGDGDLAPEYCSDGFVHQTAAAYEIWTDVLRRYVGEKIGYPVLEAETPNAQAGEQPDGTQEAAESQETGETQEVEDGTNEE